MAKHAVVTQPSPAPTAKVTAAGVGALLATVVLSVADLGDLVDLPTFWDTFLTGLTAFAAAYLKRAHSTTETAG